MRGLVWFALTLSLSGCAFISTQENLTEKELIGRWVEVVVKGNESWMTHSEYLPDGRKCTLGLSLNNSSKVSASFYESKWSLDGNMISAQVIKTSSKYVHVNEVIVDKVLNSELNRLVMQMVKPIKSQTKNEFVKMSDVATGEICNLVAKNA